MICLKICATMSFHFLFILPRRLPLFSPAFFYIFFLCHNYFIIIPIKNDSFVNKPFLENFLSYSRKYKRVKLVSIIIFVPDLYCIQCKMVPDASGILSVKKDNKIKNQLIFFPNKFLKLFVKSIPLRHLLIFPFLLFYCYLYYYLRFFMSGVQLSNAKNILILVIYKFSINRINT